MADNKVSQADAQAAFDQFDADKSGFLDAKEFFELAGAVGQLLEDAEVEAAIKQIDTGGDGKIQFDEFYAWLSAGGGSSKKSQAQIQRIKAGLLASKACRFIGKLDEAHKDVKIKVRVGTVDEAKLSVRAGLVKDKMGEEGKVTMSVDVAHQPGAANAAYLDAMFDSVNNLFKLHAPKGLTLSMSHPAENTVRVSLTLPADLDRSVREMCGALVMAQKVIGTSITGAFEVAWNARTLAEKVDFNAADLGGVQFSLSGSIPAELPQLIAEQAGVPGIDVMQKPEGADEDETCFNLNLAFSQGLINMLLQSAPDIARTPLRDLYSQMIYPQLKAQGYKYRKFAEANVAIRMGLLGIDRIVQEVRALHFRDPTGYGATVELQGFKFRDFYDALDNAVPFECYRRE